LIKYFSANTLLAAAALGNILMCLIVAQAFGLVSFMALIMLNFFFSVMYPTIYSLGLKDLGPCKQQASSYIVMGVVGGAVFPRLMGAVADHNLAMAYYFNSKGSAKKRQELIKMAVAAAAIITLN